MRFGILGDAKIARQMLVPAMRNAGAEIVCLGRRNPDQPVSDPVWQGIEQTTYDDMLARQDIDAIYNPLPNHLHVPWTIRAMQAGKHVLCEKPMALSLDELDRLEAAHQQTGKYVYEAFMVRHHPQWNWLRQVDIGRRQLAQAQFSYPPQPDGNIRNFSNMGGGPVWDIGCYCVLAGMMAFDSTPRLISAMRVAESHLDVEKSASALLDFGNGQMLHFSVSSGVSLSQNFRLVGETGWCALDVPFNPPPVTKGRLASQAVDVPLLSDGAEILFEACDHYELMVTDFTNACAEGRPADFAPSRILTDILGQIVATPFSA